MSNGAVGVEGSVVEKILASVTDHAQIVALAVYAVQAYGFGSAEDIKKVLADAGYKVDIRSLKKALKAAQSRHLISEDLSQADKHYKMRDVGNSSPLEIAHIKAVLPNLLSTEEGKALVDKLNKEHEEGTKKTKNRTITEYVKYRLTYEVETPMLGGDSDEDGVNRFRRVRGKVWFPLRLWYRRALAFRLRQQGLSETSVRYVELQDVKLAESEVPFGKGTIRRPVVVNMGNRGAGFSVHEYIEPGLKFSFEIRFPTYNFIPEEMFISPDVLDGLHIGAKSKEYGELKLLEARKLGNMGPRTVPAGAAEEPSEDAGPESAEGDEKKDGE